MTLPARMELDKEEEIIERGMQSFIEVGNALMRIRDNDLYTATHDTFESYCKERWGMERRHAYRLIDGAKVVEMCPMGHKPASERVARELTGIRNEDGELDLIKINEVWQEAVETAPQGKVTAAHVKLVIQGMEDHIESEENNEEKPEENQHDVLMAHHYSRMAINQLEKINRNDPSRKKEGVRVIQWCIKNLSGGKYHE